MFKTSFAKYLSAFVVIIFLSLLFLSGIITVIIHADMTAQKKEKLERVTSILEEQIEEDGLNDYMRFTFTIAPMLAYDSQLNIIIADENGNILLKTNNSSEGQTIETVDRNNTDSNNTLGIIPLELFEHKNEDGKMYLDLEGNMGGIIQEKSMIHGHIIEMDGVRKGYIIAYSSTVREDAVISLVRRAITNSIIVVMVTSVLAAYIMTERLIRPLRSITETAKNFGRGDFSERIPVEGKDEVSELATALNNMAESLDSLEKMRNSFLANISHDLRTPMTTISGFIDGITSGAIPEDKHEYYLGVISAEVHRLSRLVTQLLDVSRLESGERKFNFKNFDIAEMARIILISFEQKIDNKRLDVEFEADNDEMYVVADEDAVYQVLYNLCHNAIKFSKEGGKFIIRISYTNDKKIQVSVFDEGQGIDHEDSKLVFDRFFKTDKSRGLDKNGVGLGLYISKTIMDAHDEKIWVESDGANNCEFFFTLKQGSVPQKRTQTIVDGELLN